MLALFLYKCFFTCLNRTTRNISVASMNTFSKRTEFIYIAFPDKPVYLKRLALKEIESESRINGDSKSSSILGSNRKCFMIFAKCTKDNDFQGNYIQSSIKSQLAYRKSAEWVDIDSAHAVWNSMTGDDSCYQKGVVIYGPDQDSTLDTVQHIRNFTEDDQTLIPFEVKQHNHSNVYCLKCLKDIDTENEEVYFSAQSNTEKSLSPIFSMASISPVFHSFNEARIVLEKIIDVPEVKELLDLTDKYVSMETLKSSDSLPHPFVVVEGMDATGKTTLTENLQKHMGAVRYYTPPAQIKDLRAFFDRYPEIVRRAYYSMGNYIVAMDIVEECQQRPVIMDRFWHSTAAYGIANMTSSGDLPPNGDTVYTWPSDLIVPTLVLFLTVSEDVRKQRLSGRGLAATFEERSLDRDYLFRQRLCESYRRMRSTACVEIDAGGTVEEVRDKAMNILQQNGIKFPK